MSHVHVVNHDHPEDQPHAIVLVTAAGAVIPHSEGWPAGTTLQDMLNHEIAARPDLLERLQAELQKPEVAAAFKQINETWDAIHAPPAV